MDGAGSSACPGPIARYLSGICAAGLVLCAAGWLVLTPFAFGYRGRGPHDATLIDLATGGGLGAVCLITLVAWTVAWRRALRADGVLTRPQRSQARVPRRRGRNHGAPGAAADPAQVLTALRALLAPLLDPSAEPPVAPEPPAAVAAESPAAEPPATAEPPPAVIPGPRVAPEEPRVVPTGPEGIAAIESMLAGAELLMTGFEEEEAW
jgi:hypothetical protein